jgi:hypothetical protein
VKVEIELPLEQVARRAAELVLAELGERSELASPWLQGWAAAAAWLGVAESTLKHRGDVPRRRIGGSVVFHVDELAAWLAAGFEGDRRWFHVGSTSAGRGSTSGITARDRLGE